MENYVRYLRVYCSGGYCSQITRLVESCLGKARAVLVLLIGSFGNLFSTARVCDLAERSSILNWCRTSDSYSLLVFPTDIKMHGIVKKLGVIEKILAYLHECISVDGKVKTIVLGFSAIDDGMYSFLA